MSDDVRYCTDCKWSGQPKHYGKDLHFLQCYHPDSIEQLIPVARSANPRLCSVVRSPAGRSQYHPHYGKFDICGPEAKNFAPKELPDPPAPPAPGIFDRIMGLFERR